MQAYKQEQTQPAEQMMEEESAGEESSITRDENGTYHWTYEMELLHNHSFLSFLLKLILIPSAIVFAVILVYSLQSGVPFSNILMAYGILLAVLAVVAIIIWFVHVLTAMAMDNSYHLKYEMNEEGIAFVQGSEYSVSVFRTVRTVRIDRTNHQIFLNSWFLYNMICCDEKDFDFVAEYITSRCVNAFIH